MTVDRRQVLAGGLGLAALGLADQPVLAATRQRIGIIGGGILGCSIAMHLARAGAKVTLFEKNSLASGATHKSLAWINPVVLDEHYIQLRLLSMKHWRELDHELGIGVVWGGSLSWTNTEDGAAKMRAKAELLRKTGDSLQLLTDSKSVTALSPAVTTNGPIFEAMTLSQDGHVDPVFATRRFADAARRSGAVIIEQCEVEGVDRVGGILSGVTTNKGRYPVDELIFVGGGEMPHLLSLINVPFKLANKPGLVIQTTPLPIATRMAYDASSQLEFKQYSNGQVRSTFLNPPDLPQHVEVRAHQMDFPSEELRKWHGNMVLQRTSEYFPAVAKASVNEVMLCFRPMPLDDRPVVGPIPAQQGCYMVVTHSGVTLAPVLGRLVTREVVGNARAEILLPYRPERFIKA